jgi:hypothetical protein
VRPLGLLLPFLLLGAAPPTANVKTIHVPLWVATGGDSELTAANVNAKLEGRPATVRSLLGPDDPLLLLIVTDMVGDVSAIAPAKLALMGAVRQLPAAARAVILRAQDGLNVVLDPTADREPLAAAIEAMTISGNAGMLNTVETIARIADGILRKSAVRVAVLYVTDSDIRNYREDYTNPVINYSDPHDMSRRFPEGLIREKISKLDGVLERLEAPLFVVHLDYRSETLNEAYQVGLKQLAATTGGASSFCRSNAEIPGAIDGMFRTILSHYRLDLQLPARYPKIVKVELSSDGRNLSYRTEFRLDGR